MICYVCNVLMFSNVDYYCYCNNFTFLELRRFAFFWWKSGVQDFIVRKIFSYFFFLFPECIALIIYCFKNLYIYIYIFSCYFTDMLNLNAKPVGICASSQSIRQKLLDSPRSLIVTGAYGNLDHIVVTVVAVVIIIIFPFLNSVKHHIFFS